MRVWVKLTLFALICALVPMLGAGALLYNLLEKDIRTRASTELAADAAALLDDVVEDYDETASLLDLWTQMHVAQNVMIDDLDSLLSRTLERMAGRERFFDALLATDDTGIVVAASSSRHGLLDLAGSEAFRKARAGEAFNGWLTLPGENRPRLALALPIRALFRQELVVGTLVGLLDQEALLAELAAAHQQADDLHLLLHDRGSDSVLFGADEVVQRRLAERDPGNAGHVLLHGMPHLVASATLGSDHPQLRGLEWQLTLLAPEAAALAPVHDLRNVVAATGVLAAALAALLGMSLAVRTTRPVKALTQAARRLAEQDFGAEVPAAGSDEIGVLARSFAQMRDALRERNEALEHEVAVRLQTERALRDSERRFRDYASISADWFWEMDENLRVTELSESFTRVTGVPRERVLGHTRAQLSGGDSCPIREELEHKPYRDNRNAYRLPDGRELVIAANAVPVYAEEGNFVGYRGTGRDVTAETQAQRALLDAKEAAEQATRAKSEFLARMSHELRTPINGVLGMSELLAGTTLGERQRALVADIRRSGCALLGVINDILDFSKIEAGQVDLECVDFDLRRIVDDVAAIVSEAASRKGLALVVEVEDALPRAVRGDPARLRQVLTNLAGNAVKFTERGEVRLRLRGATGGAATTRAAVRFEVEDTGIGIDEQARAHVFDAFRQADGSTTRRFGGTGLGLAISRDLVALMGGELAVDSTPGQGSTFHFTLALEAAAADSVIEDDPLADALRELPPLRGRVLVVEDNPVNQVLACAMLDSIGLVHELAENGRVALESVAAHRFDLVLMDCDMPVLDGLCATRELRERETGAGARLTVVGLTANALAGDRERCLQAGMDDYLSKPFTRADLHTVLARWLPEARAPEAAGTGT